MQEFLIVAVLMAICYACHWIGFQRGQVSIKIELMNNHNELIAKLRQDNKELANWKAHLPENINNHDHEEEE